MDDSGLPAMIHAGAWLANEFDMEAISCGRGAVSDADWVLEICGRFLFFTISLHGAEIRVAAQPMDTGDAPDLLLRSRDNAAGWQTVRGVTAALERHEIKSLERPIEAGTGEFGWVIG
jgi:hypothetical protein